MKKLQLTAALLMASCGALHAANPIPLDPDVKIGQLDNGLTYYLRHNDWPAGQADFFLAQRVGSVNEEENQQGLAHFLEHMCFNGTEHFPGNTLIDYLEEIGVKFGRNLNAYTSTDETVYNISQVPSVRYSALDSCVMILGDWSGKLLLNQSDIDDERGVILNELCQRSSPASRILASLASEIYTGERYGCRMPIGKAEIISNFDRMTLVDFYHRWYHPENQAVIIVGDIDVDKMEESVRHHFSGIKASASATASSPIEVADNQQPIFLIGNDPEQSTNMVQLYIKEPILGAENAGTIEELRRDYMRSLVTDMLVERFDGKEIDPDCKWSDLGIGLQKFLLSGTRSALMLRATVVDDDDVRQAIAMLNTELQRAARHGFTPTELQRAKLTERSKINSDYANRSTVSNTELARRYSRHFTQGGLLPSAEQYYKMMKGVETTTTLEDVNQYFSEMVRADGRNLITTVYATSPTAASLSSDSLSADFADISAAALEPYIDTFANRPLLTELPAAGRIESIEEAPFGAKLLRLSNGIKVFLRHSADKPDEVMIRAVSPGGISMNYSPENKGIYKMVDDALAVSGFGGHSSTDLRKLLAGHNVKSAVKIGNTSEGLIARTSPADLAMALQLLYLKATAAERDDNAFATLMSTTRAKLENPNRTATHAMGDTIHSIVYNRHPLGEKLSAADLDRVDYDSIIALHRNRFNDMADFTYIITGNFNRDSVNGLVERYIASLPGNGRQERARDIGYGFYCGNDSFSFTHQMEQNPQSITYSFYNGEAPYELESILAAQTLGSIIKSRLLTELREKRGLTYGINTHCSITAGFNGQDTPSRFIMPIYIKVTPGHEAETFGIVRATIADLVGNGPTEAEVNKVKAYLTKSITDNRSDNGYWETVIKVYDQFGVDMDSDYEHIVERLSPATVQAFAARYLPTSSRVEIAMTPEP